MNKAYLYILCGLLLAACHKVQFQTDSIDTEQSIQKYLAGVKQELFNYKSVNYKAKVNIDDPKSSIKSINFNARIRKDSTIWLSISVTSAKVEIARISVNEDSIKILQKYESKKYMPRNFNYIHSIIPAPIDFEDLENLLAGNPFLWDHEKCQIKKLNKDEFQFISITGGIENVSTFNAHTFKLKQVNIENKVSLQKVSIEYTDYVELANRKSFSNRRAIQLINQGDTTNFDLHFTKVKLDDKLKFPFKVSAKYEVL